MKKDSTTTANYADVKIVVKASLRAFWREGDKEHFGLLLPNDTVLVAEHPHKP